MSTMRPYEALVLDIEGTICTISFVRDVLFPFASEHVEDFLRTNSSEPFTPALFDQLREATDAEIAAGDLEVRPLTDDYGAAIPDIVHNVRYWIAKDKKIAAMKELQGMIWKEGYEQHHFQSELFDDVVPSLKIVRVPIYTYSSGSTEAQQLFLEHCKQGDISLMVHYKFSIPDVGPKREALSYTRLATTVGKPAEDILFVTDVYEEAKAAREAGMRTALIVRPGNAPLPPNTDIEIIYNLAAVLTPEDVDRLRTEDQGEDGDKVEAWLECSRRPPAEESA